MEISNNIFDYATKELSQDAFICWLASFATKKAKENEETRALYDCAVEFIKTGVPDLKEKKNIEVTCIEQQWNNIDVLLTVNDAYKIIVEDKTNTNEHDNQLERYIKAVTKKYGENYKIYGVFYKTGFQSDLSEVDKVGYRIISRPQIVEIMAKYKDKIKNDIWKDYYSYLERYQNEVIKYKDLEIGQWNWYQINGFYDALKRNYFNNKPNYWAEYGYVPNQSGGFMGMWIGQYQGEKGKLKKYYDVIYELYLQMEFHSGELRICIKAGITNETYKRDRAKSFREFLTYDSNWNLILNQYNFKKPARFGTGRSMTLGIYNIKPTTSEEAEEALTSAIEQYLKFENSVEDCVQ